DAYALTEPRPPRAATAPSRDQRKRSTAASHGVLQHLMMTKPSFLASLLVVCALSAFAQSSETVLINGKILTADAQFSVRQAIAIRDGKIAAVGTNADARKAVGPKAQVIDLGGRTVIPGLIDSHMHAIRAASFFATETNWAGVATLAEALDRIKQ